MTGPWNDDTLQARLAEAVKEAAEVPADFMQAAKTAFTWHSIDAELAELTYDSDVHAADFAVVTRAETASLRAMTFVCRIPAITIELEVAQNALHGQLIPACPGEVQINSLTGPIATIPLDAVGAFTLRPLPPGPFHLLIHTPDTPNITTTWINV